MATGTTSSRQPENLSTSVFFEAYIRCRTGMPTDCLAPPPAHPPCTFANSARECTQHERHDHSRIAAYLVHDSLGGCTQTQRLGQTVLSGSGHNGRRPSPHSTIDRHLGRSSSWINCGRCAGKAVVSDGRRGAASCSRACSEWTSCVFDHSPPHRSIFAYRASQQLAPVPQFGHLQPIHH